ncbi:MAG: hypothetical protein WC958_00200 [Dehalococcoidales bacterium]
MELELEVVTISDVVDVSVVVLVVVVVTSDVVDISVVVPIVDVVWLISVVLFSAAVVVGVFVPQPTRNDARRDTVITNADIVVNLVLIVVSLYGGFSLE